MNVMLKLNTLTFKKESSLVLKPAVCAMYLLQVIIGPLKDYPLIQKTLLNDLFVRVMEVFVRIAHICKQCTVSTG